MLRRTRATGWYRDDVPIETIAVILGHSDVKTTRKSYASPSLEMLRREMSKGNSPEVKNTEKEGEPLWTNDEELAQLCGIRRERYPYLFRNTVVLTGFSSLLPLVGVKVPSQFQNSSQTAHQDDIFNPSVCQYPSQ